MRRSEEWPPGNGIGLGASGIINLSEQGHQEDGSGSGHERDSWRNEASHPTLPSYPWLVLANFRTRLPWYTGTLLLTPDDTIRVTYGPCNVKTVEVVYKLESGESAYEYLGQHLFGEGKDALAAPGWSAVGGAARKTYESSDGRWEFIVEPRFRAASTDKVFLFLNLHREQDAMPAQEEIAESLALVWDQARELMHRIDTGTSA